MQYIFDMHFGCNRYTICKIDRHQFFIFMMWAGLAKFCQQMSPGAKLYIYVTALELPQTTYGGHLNLGFFPQWGNILLITCLPLNKIEDYVSIIIKWYIGYHNQASNYFCALPLGRFDFSKLQDHFYPKSCLYVLYE